MEGPRKKNRTEKITITLPAPMLDQVNKEVESGAYGSVSEVMRAGLRALYIDDLRAEVWKGAEQAARGELVDGEKFLDDLKKELKN